MNTNEDMPGWLLEAPTELMVPPVVSQIQELPFEKLTWRNFERLTYRLAARTGRVERCRLYGNDGDDQDGIDIFSKCLDESKYHVYQCKREKAFGPAKIRSAVDEFMRGPWLAKSSKFILCTQESLQGRKRADAIEDRARLLRQHDIVFQCWDAPQLNILLKDHPGIVAEFFGPAWGDAFCSPREAKADRDGQLRSRYLDWACKTTAQFDVPGLGVSLSISDALIDLKAMHDTKDRRENLAAFHNTIKTYHEWLRLVDDNRTGKISLEDAAFARTNCIVIGGPGSGKSTLCKRLANKSLLQGRLVLLVRLKRVQDLVAAGHTFTEALALQATDGSGITTTQSLRLLEIATTLFADGLDECDPHRSDAARNLLNWSAGHPNTQILVTTRPAGHHPNLLADFSSFELLPLEANDIKSYTRKLFEASITETNEANKKCKIFNQEIHLERKGAKTLASRNPLLLGFMVRLAIDEVPIGNDRRELFTQILQLLAANSGSKSSRLTPEIAHSMINAVAYHLISNPTNTTDQLVSSLSQNTHLDARLIRETISFWESCRAIEKVSAGHHSGIVFIHPSLGEFCAARHVATFDDVALQQWLGSVARKSMWRQVVLLAAQLDKRVIPLLLAQNTTNDPCSIEAVIAAEAISESSELEAHLADVLDALSTRITSENPLISIEAALALQPLFKMEPKSPIIEKALLEDPNEWTRLAALSLLVHNTDPSILDYFSNWMQSFTAVTGKLFRKPHDPDYSILPLEAGALQHEIIKVGLPHLLAVRSKNEVERYFREGRDFSRCVSLGMLDTINKTLRHHGFTPTSKTMCYDFNLDRIDFDSVNTCPALIDAIVAASKIVIPATPAPHVSLYWIRSLIGAIHMGETMASDGVYLKRRIGFDEIIEVMKGALIAVDVDLRELGEELYCSLLQIKNNGNIPSIYENTLLKPPNWKLAASAGLDVKLLEQALGHPHPAIRYGAASLLDGGAAGGVLPAIVDRTLTGGGFDAVYSASLLLRAAFPNDCAQEILRHLRAHLRPGFEYVIEKLFDVAGDNVLNAICKEIGGWLKHRDPDFVAHVAIVIRPFVASRRIELRAAIQEAFELWRTLGTWCRDHQIPTQGTSCPKCSFCIPSPQAELLRTLADTGLYGTEELLPFTSLENGDVSRAAKEKILEFARESASVVQLILRGIEEEIVPASFLVEVSQLPSKALRPYSEAFISLLRSPNENTNRFALSALTGNWVERDTAISLASSFLVSNDPSRVTAATRILRSLLDQ